MTLPKKIIKIDNINYTVELKDYKYLLLRRLETQILQTDFPDIRLKMVSEEILTIDDIYDYYIEHKNSTQFIPKYVYFYIAIKLLKFRNRDVCSKFSTNRSVVSNCNKGSNSAESILKRIRVWKYKQLNK